METKEIVPPQGWEIEKIKGDEIFLKEKRMPVDLSKDDKIIIKQQSGMTKASFDTIFWTIITILGILGIVIRIHLSDYLSLIWCIPIVLFPLYEEKKAYNKLPEK